MQCACGEGCNNTKHGCHVATHLSVGHTNLYVVPKPFASSGPHKGRCKKGLRAGWGGGAGMHSKGGRYPLPHPGRPAYAQPLSPWQQVPASMAFVTDSNRP